jgi:hypothetical protein
LVDRCASSGRSVRGHNGADHSPGRGDPLALHGQRSQKAGLPGRITLDAKWYIGNELVAYGRKPADYDPAAFQGIHARYVSVIIDEAGRRAEVDLRCGNAMREIDAEEGKNDWVRAIIDVPGVGGGVVDRLAELDLPVVPYNGGEAPIDKERFVNARAEDYWTLRELFEQGEIDIDPDDDKLAAQLGSIKWGIDSRGRIKIESKDDMRKRGLPSPDRADAMAIAFAGKANAVPMNIESHAGESITGDLMSKAW